MKNCWDIKGCPLRTANPAESKCPAYAGQVSCWEFDWSEFYRAMPDGVEKTDWKKAMVEGCSSCEVHESHGAEVDSFLAKLDSM